MKNNNLELIKTLLHHGADLFAKDDQGQIPFAKFPTTVSNVDRKFLLKKMVCSVFGLQDEITGYENVVSGTMGKALFLFNDSDSIDDNWKNTELYMRGALALRHKEVFDLAKKEEFNHSDVLSFCVAYTHYIDKEGILVDDLKNVLMKVFSKPDFVKQLGDSLEGKCACRASYASDIIAFLTVLETIYKDVPNGQEVINKGLRLSLGVHNKLKKLQLKVFSGENENTNEVIKPALKKKTCKRTHPGDIGIGTNAKVPKNDANAKQ